MHVDTISDAKKFEETKKRIAVESPTSHSKFYSQQFQNYEKEGIVGPRSKSNVKLMIMED